MDEHFRDEGWQPDRCHTVLPGLPAGRNVAVCVRGERGLRMTTLDFGDAEKATALVRAVNASLGVDQEQERDLVSGCLFGWAHGRWATRAEAAGLARLLH